MKLKIVRSITNAYQQKGLDAHYLADESFCLHSCNDLTLNILSELDRTLKSVGILLHLDAGIDTSTHLNNTRI
jgi:hypothetical protein